jgi:hypothetical protein
MVNDIVPLLGEAHDSVPARLASIRFWRSPPSVDRPRFFNPAFSNGRKLNRELAIVPA